jgi:hypothetical protein
VATQRETKQPGRGDRAERRHGQRWPADVMLAVVRAVVDDGGNAHAVAPLAEPSP